MVICDVCSQVAVSCAEFTAINSLPPRRTAWCRTPSSWPAPSRRMPWKDSSTPCTWSTMSTCPPSHTLRPSRQGCLLSTIYLSMFVCMYVCIYVLPFLSTVYVQTTLCMEIRVQEAGRKRIVHLQYLLYVRIYCSLCTCRIIYSPIHYFLQCKHLWIEIYTELTCNKKIIITKHQFHSIAQTIVPVTDGTSPVINDYEVSAR